MTLDISNLHKSFHTKSGSQPVLRGVDLTIRAGGTQVVAFHPPPAEARLRPRSAPLHIPHPNVTYDPGRLARPILT